MVSNDSSLGQDLNQLKDAATSRAREVGQFVGLVDEDFVPGDVESTAEIAEHLTKLEEAFARAGEGFRRIDAGGWHGRAADAFAGYMDTATPKWFRAADAFESAGTAVREYQEVLAAAQKKANEAKAELDRANAASEGARENYNSRVDQHNAQVTAGTPPSSPMEPFSDPGADARARAEQAIAEARASVQEAGDRAARAVREAAGQAPDQPGLLTQLKEGFTDAGDAFVDTTGAMAAGLGAGIGGAVKLARQVNPTDPYNRAHPVKFLENNATLVMGVVGAATNPYGAVKTMVNVDGWKNDPARTLGSFIPDAALAVATGGAGGAATRVTRSLGSVAKDAKRFGKDDPDQGDKAPHDRPEQDRTGRIDPIDVTSGEMFLTQTDVELPAALALVLRRTHLSSYRSGRVFGSSWASTLDQRLEVDEVGVYFAAEDGTVSAYPHPGLGAAAFPEAGPQRSLASTEDGGYVVTDLDSGRTLHFAPGEDAERPLTSIADRNGDRIDVHHDGAGTPVELRHSGGYRIRVDSEDGLVSGLYLRRAAADGGDLELMRYGYRGERLTEVINESGAALRFDYDAEGRIIGWTDRNGIWYRYVYDAEGRCVRTEGSGGALSGTLEYDTGNRVTRVTDSLGNVTAYHLNAAGQVVREVDPLGAETVSEWDDRDRLISRTDPLGRTSRYEYDERGDPVGLTRPDGGRSFVEYNDLRLPVTIIAPDGTGWRREYDQRGNLVRSVDPTGAVTVYGRDERGRATRVIDALGGVRRVETDPAGLATAVTDPSGAVTRYERDRCGRISAIIDPSGEVTCLGWTIDGKPAWRTLPDGATERWSYDGEGNPRAHVDPIGEVTRTEVTHFDLPSAEVRPDGTRLEFGYDTELRLTSVTNEQGLVWEYHYDPAGNLVSENDFNGRTVHYVHDEAGQLRERTNGAGESASFVRDVLGNVIERRTGEVTATFSYDEAGRIVEAMDPDTQVTFQRDALGRVLAETINGRAVTSSYDALGRRLRRCTPSGAESRWGYDAGDRPVSLQAAGRVLRFGYDAAGREVERSLGEHAALAQVFDGNHRLRSQTITGGGGRRIQQRTYDYRLDGVLTGIGDQLTGGGTFDLDRAGRVATVRASGWTEQYAYGAAGNVASAAWPVAGTSPEAESVGERDYSGTLIRRAGNVRYEHDAQGRVVLRQRKCLSRKPDTWRYFWDADDRMTGVLCPDGTRWRYRYDALGRRVAKQRLDAGDRVVEQVDFVWDGTVLAEQAHSDGVTNGPSLGDARITVWDYEPGTFRPLTQRERSPLRDTPQRWVDERFFSIVTDLVGSPSELVDDAGGIAWCGRMSLWGTPVGAGGGVGGVGTPLRFPGQYADPETGFHYNYHRHYDPTTGRYASTDPLGLAAGPNPHRYVANPTSWIDPLGLMGCTSMDRAVELASNHVGGEGQVIVSGSGGFQFINRTVDANGDVIHKIARFDINQESRHVQQLGPHLNLETQINGKAVRSGPHADPHYPIDPSTVRPGDIP